MIGKTISHYKILEKLGGGGMGVVYKARDTKLDRFVALKFLPPHLNQDEENKKRFIHEAKAASALNHHNIATIYEIDEADGQMFIAMEYIEGQSLVEITGTNFTKPLRFSKVIDYAIQIAEGLAKAHEKGIVHRDIKPANILVTEHGLVKIVDFGLARMAGRTMLTKEGTTLGTVAYMSPEQAQGIEVDHRTDIWALGVILYEMLAGAHPFKGDYDQAVMYAIMNEDPEPLPTDLPEDLRSLINKTLEKNPGKRVQSAEEAVQSLRRFTGTKGDSLAQPLSPTFVQLLKRPRFAVVAFAILLILAAAIYVPYQRLLRTQRARATLSRIVTLAETDNYFEAYQLALQIEKEFKDDSTFAYWLPVISDKLTVITEPEGSCVYMQRFTPHENGKFPERKFIGTTPITQLRIARGDYKVTLERDGFAPVERMVSNRLLPGRPHSDVLLRPEVKVDVPLIAEKKLPEDMVLVHGGTYRLVSWGALTANEAVLDDFFIDKYEVSNQEFKEFVVAGGYSKREYWQHPFVKDGTEISFEQAMQLLTDLTGLPGPRNWVNQEFAKGAENQPVTSITWYEAAAYAEFARRSLPTLFQWEKAARNGAWHPDGVVMPWGPLHPQKNIKDRANFEGTAPVDVDSYAFGISPFGCYNMAGNVKEWCRNEISSGFVTGGGSWQDPAYLFASYGSHNGFYASQALGLRCVLNASGTKSDQGAMKLSLNERTPTYHPVDKSTFDGFLSLYKYDKIPPDARTLETVETQDWTRLKVTFRGAYEDRVIAYLFLPKRGKKPYQCINFIPHSGVFYGVNVAETTEYIFSPHIKAGRAILAIIPKGASEREWDPGYVPPEPNTVRYRELMVKFAVEFSLGLDYLATRDDIDPDKLAYVGVSWGSHAGVIFPAVENRYQSVIFIGGGLKKSDEQRLPEVNPINFLPYINAPKLLLNGRYDEDFPFETNARPFYNLMREPKKLALVEGGHFPPLEKRVPVINQWLDETLGPVKFE